MKDDRLKANISTFKRFDLNDKLLIEHDNHSYLGIIKDFESIGGVVVLRVREPNGQTFIVDPNDMTLRVTNFSKE